jgi:ribonuclease Z
MNKAFIATTIALLTLASTPVWAGDFRVTLLGTGTPTPRAERFTQSTLIEAGQQTLLFDLGRGVTIRLWQAGVRLSSVTAHFLTHFHSDHTVGLPDLWLTGWLPPAYGRRSTPFVMYGPVGTRALAEGLEKAFADDIRIRLLDEKNPPSGIAFDVHEFVAPATVYERDGVKVRAFVVDHGDLIKPAVGYKIEYQGHSVLISGDTRLSEEVVRHGTGVDLLIHEVAAMDPEALKRTPALQPILAHHTTPEQAGTVFARAKPKLAVYSHIARFGDAKTPSPTDADIIQQTRKTYAGPLVVGIDLMRFEIGDGISVSVIPPVREQ